MARRNRSPSWAPSVLGCKSDRKTENSIQLERVFRKHPVSGLVLDRGIEGKPLVTSHQERRKSHRIRVNLDVVLRQCPPRVQSGIAPGQSF